MVNCGLNLELEPKNFLENEVTHEKHQNNIQLLFISHLSIQKASSNDKSVNIFVEIVIIIEFKWVRNCFIPRMNAQYELVRYD